MLCHLRMQLFVLSYCLPFPCVIYWGDVSSVLVRNPPHLPALRAHLVANGQQPLAIHMVAPKAPENFFSFPLPIFCTMHPNTILEPNLDSNAHPNPQPTPNPTPKPYP